MTDPASGPRTVQLVLDTSAITAWTRGSISVGELIAEIDQDHGAVIVPSACLIEAASQVTSDEWLGVLVRRPATFVLSDDPGDWRMLAEARQLIGTLDSASAAWFAIECDVDVLTADSRRYAGIHDGSLALPIEDD